MQRRFADKVVIITGSTSGIGQAAAYRFGQEGAFLTIHGRNQDGMQETLRKLREMGVKDDRILQVFGDVREEKTLKDIIEKTAQKFGRIDVLVNNAGTIPEEEGGIAWSWRAWTSFWTCIKLINFALPYLEKTKGNIVNVSSVDGKKAHPENMYYSVAKAALDHYTRNASVLFAEKNVRINNLNPGYIRTQLKLRGEPLSKDSKSSKKAGSSEMCQ
uniref:Uncharacterized protein n=1 Tax=Ditylenchus dipsaci TaxID=166011 RepID=A0A915EKS1_9BILA